MKNIDPGLDCLCTQIQPVAGGMILGELFQPLRLSFLICEVEIIRTLTQSSCELLELLLCPAHKGEHLSAIIIVITVPPLKK